MMVLPNYNDFYFIKDSFFPDLYAYTVMPPKNKHVNIAPVLHMWICIDKNQYLPEFSRYITGIGRSI